MLLPAVQILSRKIIKPAAPTPHNLRTYKLTLFDQLAPKIHIPIIYFFPNNGSKDISEIHQQLEKSLSETLCRFHPFAGRLANDGLSVDCHDQGVEYLEAKIEVELTKFLQEGDKNARLLNKLVPSDIGETTGVKTPILAIQVTRFECGGLALTVHFSHNVADGFTGCTFTREWANLNREQRFSDQVIYPNFDLASLFPTRDLPGVNPPPENTTTRSTIVTRKYVFDEMTIRNLKTQVETNASGIKRTPSRVEVVIALIWKALIRVSEAKHGHLRSSVVCLPVNLRGKTALSTPMNSFGNFYTLVPIKFIANKHDMEIHNLVIRVRDTIQGTLEACSIASNGDEIVLSVVFNLLREIGESMFNPEVDFRLFTSMCRFLLYEADFGWGKPTWVSGAPADDHEIVALMDTKSNGIEAKVSLNEVDMLEFERDLDIVAFTSSSN